MEIEQIKLNGDERLIDALKSKGYTDIPSNVILDKTLTGIGATYAELHSCRNSIIIEPNVPVIVGKTAKNGDWLAVYSNTTVVQIKKYLKRTDVKYKKILTTPEGFKKVRKAADKSYSLIQETYFCLFDECEKLTQDCDYRVSILQPVYDFFDFKEKAFVSATPLEVSHPAFEGQGFKKLEIVPQYDYRKDLHLIVTSSYERTVREEFQRLKDSSCVCIFLNSVTGINELVNSLHLEGESRIFCSEEGVGKLKDAGFTNAVSSIDYPLAKYNFFTSRFYSAVDIELNVKPDILILTNLNNAVYTTVDPYTDAIQIVGRFRNGVSSITYISNTKKGLPQRSKEEIKGYLICSKEIYRTMKNFYDCATDRASRDAYRAALESLPFNRMLDRNGRENWFAIDNYMDEELMKNYFYDENSLYKAYDNCDSFIVYHAGYYCPLGDSERLKRENKSQSIKDKRKEIVRQLEMLGDCVTEMELEYKRDLIAADSFIVEAYDTVGKEVIEKLKYSKKKITEAMIQKQYSEKATGTEVIRLIKNSFTVGQKYTRKYTKEEIKRIYALLNIYPPKAITSKTICDFFMVSECKIKGERCYLLIEEIL